MDLGEEEKIWDEPRDVPIEAPVGTPEKERELEPA